MCQHNFCTDYRQGANVCILCGYVTQDLVFGDGWIEGNRRQSTMCPYIKEIDMVIASYMYNFFKHEEFDNQRFIPVYRHIIKVWPKKNLDLTLIN